MNPTLIFLLFRRNRRPSVAGPEVVVVADVQVSPSAAGASDQPPRGRALHQRRPRQGTQGEGGGVRKEGVGGKRIKGGDWGRRGSRGNGGAGQGRKRVVTRAGAERVTGEKVCRRNGTEREARG